jgi:endonuclease/exonuclease/phosphatase family metal-dependent hydrolase
LRHGFHAFVGRLAVLVIAASATLVALPGSAHATAYSHTYLQFNMCGNRCNGGGLTVANDTINSINNRSPQPFIVTLNEVCENQYSHMYYTLAPYYGRFDPTGPICSNGARYGNAILIRTSNFSYLGSWLLPSPSGGEARRVMCISAPLSGAPRLVACVTHISNISGNIASQISAVASRANSYYSTSGVLVGGDFNTDPWNYRMNPMYSPCYAGGTGIFYEADSYGCSRTTQNAYYNETTEGSRKLDYVFLSGSDWSNRSADATYALHSDHDPLWATARYWR